MPVIRRLLAALLLLAACMQGAAAADPACSDRPPGSTGFYRVAIAAWLKDFARRPQGILAPFDVGDATTAQAAVIAYHLIGLYELLTAGPGAVLVTIDLPGADLERTAALATGPVEAALAAAEGAVTTASLTDSGRSQVAVRFESSRPLADIMADIERRVADAQPPGSGRPTTTVVGPLPASTVYVFVRSDRYALADLSAMAGRLLRYRLEPILGVAAVRDVAAWTDDVRIWTDPARLAAYGVAPEEVAQAVARAGVPLGRGGAGALSAGAEADPSLLGDLVVKQANGVPVRVADVARIERSAQGLQVARLDGRPAVAFAVVPVAGPGASAVLGRVCAALADIAPTLPAGVEVHTLGALGFR